MPDILDILSSLFSPGEAEAAGARVPSMQDPALQQRTQEMKLQQQAAQIMLKELMRQQFAQQDPMKQFQLQQAQQRVTAGEAKARPQPSITELLGGGGVAQPSAAPEDVIFRGTTPETGTPFFTNYPEGLPAWVSPEERQQFTQRFEAARAKAPQPEAVTQPVARAQQRAQLAASIKTAYPSMPEKELTSLLDAQFPEIEAARAKQKSAEKLADYELQRAVTQKTAPAPLGLYLDKEGTPYSPIYGGDIEKGSTLYRQNSPQQKVFESTGMINAHIDQTLDKLQAISRIDRNRFTQYLNTELRRFRNDPQVSTLIQFLGPATALAVASAYAAGGGANMRGGQRLAEMFKDAIYAPGDTLRTSLTKIRTLAAVSLDGAKLNNLHPNVIKSIEDRISLIDQMIPPGKAQKGAAKGKPVTMDVFNATMQQFGGDKKKAGIALRAQGYDLNLEVK